MRGMFLYLSKAEAPTGETPSPSCPPDNPVPHMQASARVRRFATAAAFVGTFVSAPVVTPDTVTAQVVPDQPIQRRMQVPAQVPPSFLWAEPRTRLYISNSATVNSPTVDAGWQYGTPNRGLAKDVLTNDAVAQFYDSANDGDASPSYYVIGQWTSRPLNGAQTIGYGSIKAQIRAYKSFFGGTFVLAWSLRVVSRDGSTVRGTIVSLVQDDLALTTTSTNRQLNGAGANVAAQHGDHLVLEIGAYGDHTALGTAGINVGVNTGWTDLPEDNTETGTSKNPWFELPGTIVFTDEGEAWPPPYGPQIRPRNPVSRPEFQFQPGIVDATPNAPLETHPMPWLVAPVKRERGIAAQLQSDSGSQVGEPIANAEPNTTAWAWA